MRIGVPKEIKPAERRVALTPAGARELVIRGHEVLLERSAGAGAGFPDAMYSAAGAALGTVDEVFDGAELILKVKEPQPEEVARLGPHQTLFTYLHLAAEPQLAEGLRETGATCIAYETVEAADGSLPVLAPMSRVAGRLAVQAAANALTSPAGGRGILMGGLPGVEPAHVLVIGGGVAGAAAAEVAAGMGARVTVLDRSNERLWVLETLLDRRVTLLMASEDAVDALAPTADVVIGAVLSKGARAPRVLRRSHLADMRRGSVIVDISIDQGGCFETSRPTTHDDPIFETDGVLHYCVTNMPGATPSSSTRALTNATFAYVRALADQGVEEALATVPGLASGLNVAGGEIVNEIVARDVGAAAAAVS